MTNPVFALRQFAADITPGPNDGATSIIWPLLGILAIIGAAIVLGRVVRGDPYYDENASRDRRDSGPGPFLPWHDGGGN